MPKEAENASTPAPSYSEPSALPEAVAKEDAKDQASAVLKVKTTKKEAESAPKAEETETPKGRSSRMASLRKPLPNLGRSRASTRQPLAEVTPSRPILVEFRDVVKSYDHHLALDCVSVKLYKGEFLSLGSAPSGAGKSTLIKCLTLQEWPEQGRIIVAGRDITLLRSRELPYYRRKVGIVFQDFKLLPTKTVYENVAFALEVSNTTAKEIRQRVGVILDTVGMGHKRDSFPSELSGGEQQRVAIARALVHDPKILIADEPTGNLDPVNTWEIIELLYKINKSGTMVVLATHDREIVDALKKRVITMRAGKVVSDQEKGTYLV